MKRVTTVLLLLALALSAWAGGGSDDAEAAPAAAPAEVNEVEVFWHMTEYESWLRDTMKPQFEADNPDIEIKLTFVNDPENEKVLSTRLAANNLPDIFAVIGGPAVVALQEDMLLDISQFPGVMENLENYPENLFEFSRTAREYAGLSPTGIFGWPTFTVLTGVFYDKNIFASNNLQPPTTYDEFWTLLDDLKDVSGLRYPVAWGNHRWLVFNNFWQVSTALVGPDVSSRLMSGDLKFDDPEMLEVWDFYKRIADSGYADLDYKSKEWGLLEADFANLNYGVILQGPWLFNSYPKMNPDIELGVVPFPTKDGNDRHWVGFVGDRNWWVSKKATNSQDAQIRVVEWMTGPDYADRMIADANLLSFYQKPYDADSPVITEMSAKGFPVAPQANNQMDLIIPAGNPSFYSFVWDNLPKLTNEGMSTAEFGKMVEDYYGQFR